MLYKYKYKYILDEMTKCPKTHRMGIAVCHYARWGRQPLVLRRDSRRVRDHALLTRENILPIYRSVVEKL